MKRTTKYVAFDVHQASTVASVREETGPVIARGIVPTEKHAITEFVQRMRGAGRLLLGTSEERLEAGKRTFARPLRWMGPDDGR